MSQTLTKTASVAQRVLAGFDGVSMCGNVWEMFWRSVLLGARPGRGFVCFEWAEVRSDGCEWRWARGDRGGCGGGRGVGLEYSVIGTDEGTGASH